MSRTRRGALGLVFFAGWAHAAAAQDSALAAADHARLERELMEQAGNVIERFGDTFYALGLYLDESGEISGVAARNWPEFSAPPVEWADSLVAGMLEYRPLMRSGAYLVDEWRTVDAASEERTFSVFHFETPAGACHEARWRFGFDADGGVVWTPAELLPCRRRLWP